MITVENFIELYSEKLQIDCHEKKGEVKNFWSALGFDRFYDILMPEMEDTWKTMKDMGQFKWLRCHGIFKDDELDNPNWKDFPEQKKALDKIIDAGFAPVVELSKIPKQLANSKHPLGFGGDLEGWYDFIKEFLNFLFKTYGESTVKTWPFEFWNEPDHHFWSGDQPLDWQGVSNKAKIDDYCRMYDWTAKAVKDFCPELKVGGPSLTGNTIFLREFLSHCKTGTNYADGSVGAPLDFFSFHIYSNSPERVPCMENMLGRLMELKTLMDKYWGQDIPWLLTEWGVTWGGGRTVDTFPVAHRNANRASTFTLKIIKEMRNFPIEIALFWGFSEWAWKKRQDDSFDFSGQRSILTYSCIERPVAGAYRLLNQLEGEWCHVHRMTDTNNVDALCALKDRELKIVFWNHDPDSYGNAYPTRSELIVNNLPCTTGKVNLKIEGYTLEHNTYQAWQDAGSPPAPTKNQVEDIQKYSIPKLLRNTEIEYKNDIFSTGEMKIKPGEYYLLTASW